MVNLIDGYVKNSCGHEIKARMGRTLKNLGDTGAWVFYCYKEKNHEGQHGILVIIKADNGDVAEVKLNAD